MSASAGVVLLTIILVLSTSVWLGGYLTIFIVALSSRRSLSPEARVDFFRALGRDYLPLGVAALVGGLGSGAYLLQLRGWGPLPYAASALGVALVVVLAVAVGQARALTKARARRLAAGEAGTAADVKRNAASAGLLRALLGVITVALVVLGTLITLS